MSTPEIMPEQPIQPDIAPRVEQPIVPETIQSLGVSAQPQAPKPVVNDNNETIAIPVPVTPAVTDSTQSFLSVPTAVATNEKELEKGAHGPAELGVTWLDMFWLREVGKAVSKGWKIIFGQK